VDPSWLSCSALARLGASNSGPDLCLDNLGEHALPHLFSLCCGRGIAEVRQLPSSSLLLQASQVLHCRHNLACLCNAVRAAARPTCCRAPLQLPCAACLPACLPVPTAPPSPAHRCPFPRPRTRWALLRPGWVRDGTGSRTPLHPATPVPPDSPASPPPPCRCSTALAAAPSSHGRRQRPRGAAAQGLRQVHRQQFRR
jgi:hypothetical protein